MRNFITEAFKTSTRFWRDLLQNVNQLPTSKVKTSSLNTTPSHLMITEKWPKAILKLDSVGNLAVKKNHNYQLKCL